MFASEASRGKELKDTGCQSTAHSKTSLWSQFEVSWLRSCYGRYLVLIVSTFAHLSGISLSCVAFMEIFLNELMPSMRFTAGTSTRNTGYEPAYYFCISFLVLASLVWDKLVRDRDALFLDTFRFPATGDILGRHVPGAGENMEPSYFIHNNKSTSSIDCNSIVPKMY